jgi:hypothetical protein
MKETNKHGNNTLQEYQIHNHLDPANNLEIFYMNTHEKYMGTSKKPNMQKTQTRLQ